MKDHHAPRHPRDCTSHDRERWEQEKAEDEQRYRHYLETGECISHEEMMAWFDRLEYEAASKVYCASRIET